MKFTFNSFLYGKYSTARDVEASELTHLRKKKRNISTIVEFIGLSRIFEIKRQIRSYDSLDKNENKNKRKWKNTKITK